MGLYIARLLRAGALSLVAFFFSRIGSRPLLHHHYRPPGSSSHALGVILSGAGGWIAFDKRLARSLAGAGLEVIGIDSLRYFLPQQRSAEDLACDLSQTIRRCLTGRPEQEVVLIGYSQGADVLPAAVNRFEREVRRAIKLIVLIGVAPKADFRLRLIDLVTGGYSPDAQEVKPELDKLQDIPTLLIYGRHDRTTLARNLAGPLIESREIPGRHICRNSGIVAELILARLQRGA